MCGIFAASLAFAQVGKLCIALSKVYIFVLSAYYCRLKTSQWNQQSSSSQVEFFWLESLLRCVLIVLQFIWKGGGYSTGSTEQLVSWPLSLLVIRADWNLVVINYVSNLLWLAVVSVFLGCKMLNIVGFPNTWAIPGLFASAVFILVAVAELANRRFLKPKGKSTYWWLSWFLLGIHITPLGSDRCSVPVCSTDDDLLDPSAGLTTGSRNRYVNIRVPVKVSAVARLFRG